MDRSRYFRKYMELKQDEKILAEAGFQFDSYRSMLWRGGVVLFIQLLGITLSAAFAVISWWMITYFKAEHVLLPDFNLLASIVFFAALLCFSAFFFVGAIENAGKVTREHIKFWFSRFIVTSERIFIITPEQRRNPFANRLFVGTVARDDIEEARVVFCDATKKELPYPKIVVRLKNVQPNMPATFELTGVEHPDEFLSMIQTLTNGSHT